MAIDTSYFANAKIHAGHNNPALETIWMYTQEYNALGNLDTLERKAECLERLLWAVAVWITDEPPKQGKDTNQKRWDALQRLAQEVGMEAERLGIKFLTSPSDPKKIGNPNKATLGAVIATGQQRSYWLELLDPDHRPGYRLSEKYEIWLKHSTPSWGSFWKFAGNANFADDKVKYLAGQRKAEIRKVAFNAGILVSQHPNPVKFNQPFSTQNLVTLSCGQGWGIFVVDLGGNLYVHKHIEGKWHHSTFLSGGAVQSAGEIVVDGGDIKVITAKSGHYMPTVKEMKRFVQLFPLTPGDAIIRPDFNDEAAGGPPAFYRVRDYRSQPSPAALKRGEVQAAIPTWARNSSAVTAMIAKIPV